MMKTKTLNLGLLVLTFLTVACGSASNNNINGGVGTTFAPNIGGIQCPLPSPFPTTIAANSAPFYFGTPTPWGSDWFFDYGSSSTLYPQISPNVPQSVVSAASTNYVICPRTEVTFVGQVELGEAEDDFWDIFDFLDDNFDKHAYSQLVVSNGIDQAFAMKSGDTVVFDSPNAGFLSFGANQDVVYSDSGLTQEKTCNGNQCELARFTFNLLQIRYLPAN